MLTDSTNWLDPLRKTLDEAFGSIPFFFRNDDAGWEDERLFELLDVFADYDVPIDVAVIPKAISRETAASLGQRREENRKHVSFHQHGYAHVNHEQIGRKCEFGESRSSDLQRADIAAGKALLTDLLGPITESIFTPPWNRCTTSTAACLQREGFTLLSRDSTATQFNLPGLRELSVSIDWFGHRKGVRLTPDEIGDSLSKAAASQAPVGVMLHHALIDDEERRRIVELLELLSSHSQASCRLMRDLVLPFERKATSCEKF
jgi:peptidoglycan/xylan/chitin deacetylase (PgdA/CDA1 family)